MQPFKLIREGKGPVAICCMAPDARDLLDRAMDGWNAHLGSRRRAGTPMPNDPAYSFAYWLFRYSGLVVGATDSPAGAPVPAVDKRSEAEPSGVPSRSTPNASAVSTSPARSSAEEGTTTGEAMVNGFWRKMDALTSPAASPPEGAAGEPLTIILAKREAHADCLVITQVCDRDEAERRAERFYPLPSEPRVA